MIYVEVILPLPLPGTFTYSVPDEFADYAQPGHRVVVSFGKTQFHTGVIRRIVEKQDHLSRIKPIIDALDLEPLVSEDQFLFYEWIAEYYLCTLGETLQAALPSGFKLSSEAFISLAPNAEPDLYILTEKEEWILRKLEDKDLHINDVRKLTGLEQPIKLIKSLQERGLIQLLEKLKDKYTPKREKRIRLTQPYLQEAQLDELLQQLERRTKQIDALVMYLRDVPVLQDPSQNLLGASKPEMIKEGVSPSSLQTLIKNGVFEEWDEIVDRFGYNSLNIGPLPELSDIQGLKRDQILTAFETQRTVLLKGVTGSGKTEIYMSLIHQVIEQGGRVLYLLPEIALTTQIIGRFRKIFGNRFGIYHSRFSDTERMEVWKKCLKGEFDFIIGVRSAVFLPMTNVELIIVDEEHESSFKQHDPAPRYHARDAAIYLAHQLDAKILLGTATPSLETYTNARSGKYALIELNERFSDQPKPIYQLVDLTDERKRKTIKGSFSSRLLNELQEVIGREKQGILFQNRRGYAPVVMCESCGHTPKCPNCSVSLTYHIYANTLNCHYCGYKESMVETCASCGERSLKTVGLGTEKIEEELSILLPEVRIQRMDLDSTRSKYAYQDIIDRFERREIDVLVGTQMISKGLDFERVELVGIFDADRIIHFPDFRSHERAYQLLTQVGGRAGRKLERGRVIVQTNDPSLKLLTQIQQEDYEGFYHDEMKERHKFRYPPFYRLIQVTIRHKDKQTAYEAADQLSFFLRKQLGERSSPPIEPTISKIRNYYRFQLVIRLEKEGINLPGVREFLKSSRDTLLALQSFKSVRVHFDVDPI
ncbi:MAG: primosomal protein N' [Cytophagales bacterium]|nr:primosomal protein N' [Cytophagales bacterium]